MLAEPDRTGADCRDFIQGRRELDRMHGGFGLTHMCPPILVAVIGYGLPEDRNRRWRQVLICIL
jgi:hypothetical protein